MQDFIADIIKNADLLAFIAVGIFVLVMTIAMLETKNLTHAIIFLAIIFSGIAIIFLILNAEFIAMIQMSVFAGGVVVLFLFALMLTRSEEFMIRGSLNRWTNAGIAVILIFTFTIFVYPIIRTYSGTIDPFDPLVITDFPQGIAGVGFALFNLYQIAFLILGLLVLSIMIGAIYLVKNEPGDDIRIVKNYDDPRTHENNSNLLEENNS